MKQGSNTIFNIVAFQLAAALCAICYTVMFLDTAPPMLDFKVR